MFALRNINHELIESFRLINISARDSHRIFRNLDNRAPQSGFDDLGNFSDSGTVFDEGDKPEESDCEFLNRTFRSSGETAEGFLGLIRGKINASRFDSHSSIKNGTVTVQWKRE